MGLSIFVVGRMETGSAGDWHDPSGVFPLLEDLAEEGDDMKTELTRYFRNSLYWPAAMCSGRYPQSSGIRQAP